MAHHEDTHDHSHDSTEGNRQYYNKGWHLPLLALTGVCLIFSIGMGFLLEVSGTDKWGKCDEQHTCDGHCNHEGDAHKDGGHGDAHGTPATHEAAATEDHSKADSAAEVTAAPTDSVKHSDSAAEKQPADGHGH